MGTKKRNMHLGAFVFGAGQHVAAWRHERTASDKLLDKRLYEQLAVTAERGKLDMVLILEQLAINEDHGVIAGDKPFPTPDTLTLANLMAAATQKIGIVATLTTSYNEPFQVAHKFAALSHMTQGRIGWNMVTTQDNKVAFNFSREGHFDHSERYVRAGQFVDAVQQLWDHTGQGAVSAGGNGFDIRGALPLPPLRHGRPLRLQAGSSASGKHFGAQYADAIFTAQTTLEEAQAFYADIQQLAQTKYNRPPHAVKILPGLAPYLADTEKEARKLESELYDLVSVEHGLRVVSNLIDLDLSKFPLDGPVPLELIKPENSNNRKARIQIIRDTAERERFTVRELCKWAAKGSGHAPFVGTPGQVADFMEKWFTADACDGFIIMPPLYPSSLEGFVDKVIPILQERGLFRTDYTGSTLREHLIS